MRYVVGIGSSGPFAADNVAHGLRLIARHPFMRVLATSRLWQNPAMGGVTTARFVNAAAVVDSALGPAALLGALHSVEHEIGRVRGQKNAARALDLDILLNMDQLAPSTSPAVPHPALAQRAFAVVPAIEALERAHIAVPIALTTATPPAIPMFVVDAAG